MYSHITIDIISPNSLNWQTVLEYICAFMLGSIGEIHQTMHKCMCMSVGMGMRICVCLCGAYMFA